MGVLLDMGNASFGKRTSRISVVFVRGPGPVLCDKLEAWGSDITYANVEATDDP